MHENRPDGRLGDRVLQPVGWSDFFSGYWEKKPLHVSRDDPDYFSDCLSIGSLESLLSTQTVYFPDVQLTQAGIARPQHSYADDGGRILPLRLFGEYAAGATVIVSQAHRFIESLAHLRRDLLGRLQLNCQTNIYLSPDGKQGFNPHYDAHDVLILQIEGSKCFRFYEGGVALPMVYQRFDSAIHEAGALSQEIVLQPGDTLYVPRGCMHDAVAMPGSPSLHITVGIFPIVLSDLLRELVQIQSERDSGSRRSIPRADWVPGEVPAVDNHSLDQEIDTLLSTLSSRDMLEEALCRLRDSVAMSGTPDCQGAGSVALATVSLLPMTRFALRRDRLLNSEWHNGQLLLRTPGQVLEFSGAMATAMGWLIGDSGKTVRIVDIPDIDEAQGIALCRSLLEANLLDIVGDDP